MTKNFKILNDFEFKLNNDEIYAGIERIEKNIKENEFNYIYSDGRGVLELMLQNKYPEFDSLEDVIKQLRYHEALPSKVTNALYSIKQRGNEGSHLVVKKSDKPFNIKVDIFATVEFLKQLFIVVKYFISELNSDKWRKEYSEEYTFNSNIYLPNMMREEETQKSEDVSPNSETIETKLKGIFELIQSDFPFFIPTYQREYSWSEENINVFLQDIMDRVKDKKAHYMGTLAIALDDKNNLLRLIDGQQRITTSLLLIKALINKFEKSRALKMPKELEELKGKLSKKYINKAGEFGELNNVQKILSNLITKDATFVKSRAMINYTLICDFLDNLTSAEVDEFYTSFVFSFVIAELRFKNDLKNEIQIFENLNSKGMELSQWDLIKNYIYKNIDINFLIENENNVEELLRRMFIIPSSLSFGSSKMYDKISNFFVFYSRIKSKLINDTVLSDKGKIHKIFATMWPEDKEKMFSNIDDIKESLSDAAKYFKIFTYLEGKEYLSYDNPLFEYRLSLENLSIKDTHYALVINAIYNSSEWVENNLIRISKEKENELFEFISDIDKYVTRVLVVNNTGQSLSTFFDQSISDKLDVSHSLFLKNITQANTANALPSWKNFKNELKTKDNWQQGYALAVLRTANFKVSERLSRRYEVVIKPSLEHIFPQKPTDDSEWFSQEGITQTKFKIKHMERLNKLGNYLILSQTLNSKAKNSDFLDKLSHYKSDKETILIKGEPGKLMNLLMKRSFTFDDIDERTKELAELIAMLYKLSNEK